MQENVMYDIPMTICLILNYTAENFIFVSTKKKKPINQHCKEYKFDQEWLNYYKKKTMFYI